jgi:hypothetical protein
MPLTATELVRLYPLVRENWLEAQRIICAYEREFRKNKKISGWLKGGTILSAVATALSPITPIWQVGTVAGVLTAALAAMEQQYSPAKNLQEFWDHRGKLEAIKRELISCVYSIGGAQDFDTGRRIVDQIGAKVTEVAKIPFEITASDRNEAEQKLRDSVLASFVSGESAPANLQDDEPAPIGVDAPDIIPVGRTRIVAAGA